MWLGHYRSQVTTDDRDLVLKSTKFQESTVRIYYQQYVTVKKKKKKKKKKIPDKPRSRAKELFPCRPLTVNSQCLNVI